MVTYFRDTFRRKTEGIRAHSRSRRNPLAAAALPGDLGADRAAAVAEGGLETVSHHLSWSGKMLAGPTPGDRISRQADGPPPMFFGPFGVHRIGWEQVFVAEGATVQLSVIARITS